MLKIIKSWLIWSISLLLVLVALIAGAAWHWATSPATMLADPADYRIESGAGARSVARAMNEAGIQINEDLFVIMARLSGRDVMIKAGAYEATRGDSPWAMLGRMASGDMTQTRITLLEGWTYKRIREALAQHPDVRSTLDGIDDAQLLKKLGVEYPSPEGIFFPDTYVFTPGTTDFDILRRAYLAQKSLLDRLWPRRDPEIPLKTPYEALIMASIIEKETGHAADRDRVSGVFANRLRLGMPLQTDPAVIYGMGEKYQGRIRKRDLTTDTPWNTYTRNGLPPTPIANSGRAALESALNPESHKYLYFVSRGDGTSEFSENLRAHNRAVAKYILGRD
ncbi:MAG: endolytic transglycosylase MltG [Pusillimonas sp.]|nr:endolytic transglycosylase MltG [Pusillimonas sp.]